jgi:hypothetical protein
MKRYLVVVLLLALCLVPVTSAAAAGSEPAYDVRFTGVIDVVPAEEGDPWTIAGYQVNVDEETRLRLTQGPAEVGDWAAVIADRDGEGDLVASQIVVSRPEVRLKGPIASIPDGRVGTWDVAGQDIVVTGDTRFNERGGPLVVGGWAEVYALEEGGALTALRIRSIEFQEEVEIYGVIRAFSDTSWTLSTIDLAVDDATMATAAPQLELLAHAAATMGVNGSLLARTLRVFWQEPGGLHPAVQFRGTVETLPGEGLTGDWTVSGRTVVVTEATSIIQLKAVVEVGSTVHVVGWEVDGAVQAVQITVIAGEMRGWVFYHAGNIEGMPPHGLAGEWTIGGHQVRVTQQTRVTGEQYARIGAPAEVGGVQLRDGERIATWLRIRKTDGPGPGPAVTP